MGQRRGPSRTWGPSGGHHGGEGIPRGGGGDTNTHTRHDTPGTAGEVPTVRRSPGRPGVSVARGGTGRDTGSPGAHVRQVGACGRARGSAEAPLSPPPWGPPCRPGPCWGVRSGVRGACGSASGPSWCWWRSTRWRVAARVPAWLRAAGPSRPGPTAASPGSTRTWRNALWPSWPPPGPQCPPTPLVACRTSPPGPGYPPLPAPRDSLRGRRAVDPGGGTLCLRLGPRCRGTSWGPPPTRCTCSGCRRPTPAAGDPPLTLHPPPMTVPTARCSSAPRGDPAAPRRLLGPGGLCRPAGATHCPGRPPRPSTGGSVGRSCPQEGLVPPGTARRCRGQQPAGSGHRGAGGGSGGRGDTSSLTPPVWWSEPSTCHPRSDSRSAMPGHRPWGLAPLLAALPCPPGLAALLLRPRPPGSPPAAPAARGRARGAAGVPAGGPRRGGRCCTPRRCGRPCPASAGTRRPTRTRMPRAAWGAPGSGSAETPAPTAAAAAAWRAPEPPRAPPAQPLHERRGLTGCGTLGRGLPGCGSQGRSLGGLGGGAQGWSSHGLTPIKAPGSRRAASVPVCVRSRGGGHHPLRLLWSPQQGHRCLGTPP